MEGSHDRAFHGRNPRSVQSRCRPCTCRSARGRDETSRRSSGSAQADTTLCTWRSSTASSTSARGRRARACRASRRSSTTRSARSSSASPASAPAARPAHRGAGARPPGRAARRGPPRRALPRAQAGAHIGFNPEIYTLYGLGDRVGGPTRRRVPRRRRAGHDGLPVRAAADRRRPRDRASKRPMTASATARSRGSSRRYPSRPTTSAASARCTSASRRTATPRSRPTRLLAIVEGSMSSEIYELMKRSDEAAVVEKAHRRPRFVEDCVREMIAGVVERFGALLRRRALRLRPPGELLRDDPPAQRRRRALRAARQAVRHELDTGEHVDAPHLAARVARRRRASELAASGPHEHAADVGGRGSAGLAALLGLAQHPPQAEEVVDARRDRDRRPTA